jgi:hypothetical protein
MTTCPRRIPAARPAAMLLAALSGVLVACTAPPGPPATGLSLSPGGLGLVHWDEPWEEALPVLVAALGPPDDPGTPIPSSACPFTFREPRWGDLQVFVTDKGSGPRVNGFHWGDRATRNSFTAHPAPTGPGSPRLANPWNLRIGTVVPDGPALEARVSSVYPGARIQTVAPIFDPGLATAIGSRRLSIGLHARTGGGYLVERIWAFDPAEIPCR